LRESGPCAENRPFSRRDVIDPWRAVSNDEPKRNAAKLASLWTSTCDPGGLLPAQSRMTARVEMKKPPPRPCQTRRRPLHGSCTAEPTRRITGCQPKGSRAISTTISADPRAVLRGDRPFWLKFCVRFKGSARESPGQGQTTRGFPGRVYFLIIGRCSRHNQENRHYQHVSERILTVPPIEKAQGSRSVAGSALLRTGP
jgi:hypothetical protein